MAKRLSDLCIDLGWTYNDIRNWLVRLDLRTAYASTVAGAARLFTAENALELSLIDAYTRIGASPQTAVALAEPTVRNFQAGTKIHEWHVFDAGDFAAGRMVDSLDAVSFKSSVSRAPVFSMVHLREIVVRVDALFAPETVEA